MSDYQLIASVPNKCTESYYGTLDLCQPLKKPVVDHNCCITKMTYYFWDGYGYSYATLPDSEVRIWDAETSVTPGTGINENECGINEVGYGTSFDANFYVNFGCTIKVTISGEFPKSKRYNIYDPYYARSNGYVTFYANNLKVDNYGTWSPSFSGATDANYYLASAAPSLYLLLNKAIATDRVCCYSYAQPCDYIDDTKCTNEYTCDEYNMYDKGYVYDTEFKTYTWTYTCDVPCGIVVNISRYGTYTSERNAGTYVDVKIETLSSKCSVGDP